MGSKIKQSVAPATRRRRQEIFSQGEPGKASNYISFFPKLVRETKEAILLVILFARVSSCAQHYKGNLRGQFNWLQKRLKRYGNVRIIAEIKDVASGWKEERDGLKRAAAIALKNGAIILTETTDRYIRSPYYHSQKNPSVQPTDAEYMDLIQSLDGVVLATMLHPDTHWKKVRSHQSKRGQQTKGNKGGRPKINEPGYKKKRRLEKLPLVLQLHNRGVTLGDIHVLTGIPKSTVWYWVVNHNDEGI